MVSSDEPIRILLADDQTLVRESLRVLIEEQPHLLVVGEAADKARALSEIARAHPHLIILDLYLGGECSLNFMGELYSLDENLRVLVLTGVRDPELHRKAIQSGAMGVMMKDSTPETLIKAIEKVCAGEAWVDRSMMATFLIEARRSGQPKRPDPETLKIGSLTDREREVIALVAEGLGTRALAERLFISEKTVRNHLSSIYSKLDLSNRLELALYANRHELIIKVDSNPSKVLQF